jgi:hypothetical protein
MRPKKVYALKSLLFLIPVCGILHITYWDITDDTSGIVTLPITYFLFALNYTTIIFFKESHCTLCRFYEVQYKLYDW